MINSNDWSNRLWLYFKGRFTRKQKHQQPVPNYIGHTDDPDRRLFEHNNTESVTFTSKHRPWNLVFKYPVSESWSDAIIIERYLKRRKGKVLLEKLILKQEDQTFVGSFFKKIFNKQGLKRTIG